MVESEQDFNSLVRRKIAEREFKPICIEVTKRKENARKAMRKYEKTEHAKQKHRRWRQTDAGKASDKRRGLRYREKNKDNPEYWRCKHLSSTRCYRKRRTNALWLLLTFVPT